VGPGKLYKCTIPSGAYYFMFVSRKVDSSILRPLGSLINFTEIDPSVGLQRCWETGEAAEDAHALR